MRSVSASVDAVHGCATLVGEFRSSGAGMAGHRECTPEARAALRAFAFERVQLAQSNAACQHCLRAEQHKATKLLSHETLSNYKLAGRSLSGVGT